MGARAAWRESPQSSDSNDDMVSTGGGRKCGRDAASGGGVRSGAGGGGGSPLLPSPVAAKLDRWRAGELVPAGEVGVMVQSLQTAMNLLWRIKTVTVTALKILFNWSL